jgi:hypothetical protein
MEIKMPDFWQGLEAYDTSGELRTWAARVDSGLQRVIESMSSFDGSEQAELKEACELMERSLRYGAGALEELFALSSSDKPEDAGWMSWWAALGPTSHQQPDAH